MSKCRMCGEFPDRLWLLCVNSDDGMNAAVEVYSTQELAYKAAKNALRDLAALGRYERIYHPWDPGNGEAYDVPRCWPPNEARVSVRDTWVDPLYGWAGAESEGE